MHEYQYETIQIPVGLIIFSILLSIFMIISMWRVYVKAEQPGWAALVPIYNFIVLLKIVKKEWWWVFLVLIPIVNIVILIIVYNELSKAFGKGAGFTVGLILMPFVFFAILAFDGSKYLWGTQKADEPNSPLDQF